MVWANWDAVTSLTAAAAVTDRIKLLTCVLLAPLRGTAVLAKQLATLDQVAGPSRLWLGMAVGGRDDDYAEADVAFNKRGERFDGQLRYLNELWTEEQGGSRVGPRPATQGRPGPDRQSVIGCGPPSYRGRQRSPVAGAPSLLYRG